MDELLPLDSRSQLCRDTITLNPKPYTVSARRINQHQPILGLLGTRDSPSQGMHPPPHTAGCVGEPFLHSFCSRNVARCLRRTHPPCNSGIIGLQADPVITLIIPNNHYYKEGVHPEMPINPEALIIFKSSGAFRPKSPKGRECMEKVPHDSV